MDTNRIASNLSMVWEVRLIGAGEFIRLLECQVLPTSLCTQIGVCLHGVVTMFFPFRDWIH